MYINKLLADRIIVLTLAIAATCIVTLQIGIRINVCGWMTNMSNVFCLPTVFVINYDSALTVATKPKDHYFCCVLEVESRINLVVNVIYQQSLSRGAAI